MISIKEDQALDQRLSQWYKDRNNEKMYKWINAANFSEDTRNLVIRAIQMFTQDKVAFAEAITRPLKWTDSEGITRTTGWAAYAVYIFLRRKVDRSLAYQGKNKYQRAFEDFLYVAEKHKMKIDYK